MTPSAESLLNPTFMKGIFKRPTSTHFLPAACYFSILYLETQVEGDDDAEEKKKTSGIGEARV